MKNHSWLLLAAILALLLVVQQVGCNDDDDDDDNDDSPNGDDDDDNNNDDNDDDNDDDDDDNDDDNDDDDGNDDDDSIGEGFPECDVDENWPPHLYAVNLIVNGEVVEQPYTATTDDALALSFEYFDAECNIECLPGRPDTYRGRFLVRLNQQDEENLSEEAWTQLRRHQWGVPGIGCSSAESGLYAIDLDPQDWVVDESDVREYPFIVTLEDACDASSGAFGMMLLDFTVHAAK